MAGISNKNVLPSQLACKDLHKIRSDKFFGETDKKFNKKHPSVVYIQFMWLQDLKIWLEGNKTSYVSKNIEVRMVLIKWIYDPNYSMNVRGSAKSKNNDFNSLTLSYYRVLRLRKVSGYWK